MSDKTEIKLEFVGTAGINPFIAQVSSPRACMDNNHFSQRPSLLDPDEPMIVSGIEYELGSYINDVKTEHDCVVKAVIPKFRSGNPDGFDTETLLLVEYEKNGSLWLDLIEIPEYKSSHGFFGYRLKPTEAYKNIHYNAPLPKETILGMTDSYSPDSGIYRYGVNANVAFMSHPAVAEDGFGVRAGFLHKLRFTSVTKRVINITKETIPLNINGDDVNFKFLPDIGQPVRPDGLLCATRSRNDWFSIIDMSDRNIAELDSTFDTPVYVPPGSVVTDIKVVRGNYNKPEFSSAMTTQLDVYAEMLINYYRNIVNQYDKIMAEKKVMYGDANVVKQTGRLRRFIADCMIKVNAATTGKTKLCYRRLPIDQYYIEVTVVSVITPNLGFKLTDISGGKGVICAIIPDHEMPVDENGVVVDIIADSSPNVSRMKLSAVYNHYLGAVARDNRQRLINHYTNLYGENYINNLNPEDVAFGINYLRGLYSNVNTEMVEFIDSLNYEEQHHHLVTCLTKMLKIYYPPDNGISPVDFIKAFEVSPYKPHMGKVTYVDNLGRTVTTEDDVRVGNMSIIPLEKIALDYNAVSSARVNSFNFPIKGSNADKYKYPHNLTPTTTLGETEVRILRSFADPVMVAEMIDLALNPVSHKLLIKATLESDVAYNKNIDIPREMVEYGQTKSLLLMRHIFNAAGFDYEYESLEQDAPF